MITKHVLGLTLIELVVSIVIMSIAVTSVMMLVSQVSRASADPLIRVQAKAIAEAYMEEMLGLPMREPEEGVVEVNGPEINESRSNFDDVWDYDGLSDQAGAVSQNSVAIAGLEAYNVAVAISSGHTLTGVNGNSVEGGKQVTVTVTHDGDANFSLTLVTYRLL